MHFTDISTVLQQSTTGVKSSLLFLCLLLCQSPTEGRRSPREGLRSLTRVMQSPREGYWSFNIVGGLVLNLTIFSIKIPSITLGYTWCWLILAPGVIQLILLDGASIDRQIRQLARDPRYSTVLTMRPGVATRSSSDSNVTQLISRDPSQPAAQISE